MYLSQNNACTLNQRTRCPVNAHLTPGPGIFFNAFIHMRGLSVNVETLAFYPEHDDVDK